MENLPSVRRVDALENNTVIRLLFSKLIMETEIIGMLSDTGLTAIQFEKSAPAQ